LAPAAAVARDVLSRYRRIFQLGGQAGFVYPYTPGPAIPAETDLLHLSADAGLVGRTYPTRLGLVGDIRTSVAALVPLVAARVDQAAAAAALGRRSAESTASAERYDTTASGRYDTVPIHPMAAVHALLQALPAGGVVVDEAITTGTYVRGLHRTSSPGSYYFCRGGGLGWGMPAALGVKLARPDRPVLCVVGDGAALYAIQSLWTAAHSNIPVVFAIVNNRQYRILRDNLAGSGGQSARTGTFIAMDLDGPPIDYVSLAAGFGVGGALVEKAADVVDAATAAFESGRPTLLEVPIQSG
jgi:benzoylformate decarboxylase